MNLMTPSDIERLAREQNMTLADVCRKAGVAPSTFTRWKSGITEPTLGIYRRFVEAVSPVSPSPRSEQDAA